MQLSLTQRISNKIIKIKNNFWGEDLDAFPKKIDALIIGRLIARYLKYRKKNPDYKSIPVIINSFNRYESLASLITWLEKIQIKTIVIIDNGSTYPPLLNFYKTTKHTVLFCANLGPNALWLNTKLWLKIRNNYFIYTDADVVPYESCPSNAIDYLLNILLKDPSLEKAGFALSIDDLPDHYKKKSEVIKWESQFWENELSPNIYLARIDTTFAVYRPRGRGGSNRKCVRTGYPYLAKHTPWYENSESPSDEDIFYAKAVKKGISTWVDGFGIIRPN